ncbi:MAG TPA: hypothetical protein VNQ81_09780 [Povalibacter sp.]|nr:hypothetical protein [Povalibacter sp.]
MLTTYPGQLPLRQGSFRIRRHGGRRIFVKGYIEEIGDHARCIGLAALDVVTPQEPIDAPPRYFDDRGTHWGTQASRNTSSSTAPGRSHIDTDRRRGEVVRTSIPTAGTPAMTLASEWS